VRPGSEFPRALILTFDIATLTRDEAVNIYWREWWLRFGFAQLPDAIGAKTFDSRR